MNLTKPINFVIKCSTHSVIIAGFFLLAETSVQAQSQTESQVAKGAANPSNPVNPNNINTPAAINRALNRVTIKTVTANAEPGVGFRNPAISLNTGYIGSNDNRPAGLESDQYSVQLGVDFQTYYDFVVGVFYTHVIENSSYDDLEPIGFSFSADTTTNMATFFISRAFYDMLIAGATLSFGASDIDMPVTGGTTEIDRFLISPSVFFGFAKAWDICSFSSILSYIHDDSQFSTKRNDFGPLPSDFATDAGTMTWTNKFTYFVMDKWDISVEFGLTQVLYSDVSALPDDDDFWGTVGVGTSYYIGSHWELNGRFRYDVMNDNYQESFYGDLGLTYSF